MGRLGPETPGDDTLWIVAGSPVSIQSPASRKPNSTGCHGVSQKALRAGLAA